MREQIIGLGVLSAALAGWLVTLYLCPLELLAVTLAVGWLPAYWTR